MFGLRKNRSPLTTARQVDIDLLLRRNVELISPEWVRQVDVVTDVKPWGLDSVQGQQRLEVAAGQVLQRLPAAVTRCELAIRSLEDLTFPSIYTPPQDGKAAVITLAGETLDDPLRTVIEVAYQYACHFWHQFTDGRELDLHPRTTNLFPICCGLGVLASDACFYDKNWTQAGWSGWSMSRAGYYNAAEIGYALALFCRTRHETRPPWISSLRLDSRVNFEKAQNYFAAQARNGNRLLFEAESIPSTRCDPRELADWLTSEDAVLAYASSLALVQRDDLPPLVAESALTAIRRGDRDLAPSATRVLGRLRTIEPEVESCLQRLITRGSAVMRAAAFESAEKLGMSLDPFQPQLVRLLKQPAVDPLPVLEIIRRQGKSFASMAPTICQMIGYSIRDQEEEWTRELVEGLEAIVDDPQASIEKHIRSPKLREQAFQQLQRQQSQHEAKDSLCEPEQLG
ncbi:MAG: hypothetical protein P8L85_06330 [Rubripirellula sp.]|nr:hypothetical protein [Rubripirellula sp.]